MSRKIVFVHEFDEVWIEPHKDRAITKPLSNLARISQS